MNTRGAILGIQELNQLPIDKFKNFYLRADDFSLEAKSTTVFGRIFQWIKRACCPKIYKPENVFKNLVAYAAFTPSNEKPLSSNINLIDEKFKDWAARLKKADQNRILLPQQNQTALKIYQAATSTLEIDLNQFLGAKIGRKLKSGFKILFVALKSQGYDDSFCKEFLKIAGMSEGSSFREFLLHLELNQENVIHLFELIKDLAQAHRNAKLLPNSSYNQGYISKAFLPYLASYSERIKNNYSQEEYFFIDNYSFQDSLQKLIKSTEAPLNG